MIGLGCLGIERVYVRMRKNPSEIGLEFHFIELQVRASRGIRGRHVTCGENQIIRLNLARS